MRQYSIDQVNVAWFGVDFAEGLAPGSTIVDTPANPAFTNNETRARGGTTSTHNPAKSGTITMLIAQTSKCYQQLLTIHKADRDPNQRNKVEPMKIKDSSSNYVVNYKNTRLTTRPGLGRGTAEAAVSFVFSYEMYDDQPNENNLTNIVGA